MGAADTVCVYCLVVIVNIQRVTSQPIFGTRMWCDLFCDDDYYDSVSSTTSLEDLFDALWDPCTDCEPQQPRTTTMNPMMQRPYNIVIPPSTGMNLTMTNTGGLWNMNFVPWSPSPATPTPPLVPLASATPAPVVANATTAAPAAGASAANATTAAPAATTAAG